MTIIFSLQTIVSSFHWWPLPLSPDVQDAAYAADDCEESLWMLVQVVSLVSLGQGSGLTVLTTIRGMRGSQSRPGCKYSQRVRVTQILQIPAEYSTKSDIYWIPGMAPDPWCPDTQGRWGWRRGSSGWWPSCPRWRRGQGWCCPYHSRGHMTWGWWSGGWSGSWWSPLTSRLHVIFFRNKKIISIPGLRCPAEVTSCGRDQGKCNSNLLLNIKRANAMDYTMSTYIIIGKCNTNFNFKEFKKDLITVGVLICVIICNLS